MATVRKADTPEMFSEIAPRYDLLNHVLSLNIDRAWRRALVDHAELPAAYRLLDACTGTGDVAIEFAARRPGGRIVGVDRSAGMLEIGERKVHKRGLADRVEMLMGDVMSLPFDEGSFDAVTIAFGLRNLPDYPAGIREMARVLKPGGRLLILEFSPPSGGLRLKGYTFYLRRVLPVIGGIVSGSRRAYRYLATSIDAFLTREEVFDVMETASLTDKRASQLTGGIAYIYSGVKRAV